VAASLKDPSLIKLLGQTTNGALIMELLQGFEGLAGPPSLETCSRDVYPTDRQLSEDFAWKIAMSLLQVLHKLHGKGICHGDFYSHNILISSSSEKVKLSDFGAAFFYQPSSKYGDYIQRIELRSYGVLVEELQTLVATTTKAQENRWGELTKACQDQSATFDGLLAQFQLVDK
jgi:serine/threonine protein kinase